MGQTFQNPYWVIAGNPPKLFKNTTPASFPTLPFVNPPMGTVSYASRVQTAVNGVFDSCGNPIFYVAGDFVFDEDGIKIGELVEKDFQIKSPNFNDTPLRTENFEAVICEVPESPGEYFIFCADANSGGTTIYAYQYDAIAKVLDPDPWELPTQLIDGEPPLAGNNSRFALSQIDRRGDRTLYVLGESGLVKITIDASVSSKNDLVGDALFIYSTVEACPELELSHDGETLAWATYHGSYSIIHFFDVTTSQHTTFQPSQQGINYIAGLEFLPDERLVVSISWNSPILQNLNGIGYFDAALSSFYFIGNSAAYQGGMVELGISNSSTWNIYGCNLQNAVRIPFTASGTPAISNTISGSFGYYVSPYGFANAVGLPDQVDGYVYPYSTCGTGGGGTESTEFISTSEEPITPSFSFTPLITITNHE